MSLFYGIVSAGLLEPKFEEQQGFKATFRKDVYTEDYLRGLGLNERQMKAVRYVKEKGKITNKEFQQITGVKERLASIELADLVIKGIFFKHGTTGKGTFCTAAKTHKTH